MRKRLLSLILVICLIFGILPVKANAAASDFENHWAKTAIEALQAKGIMKGDGQGRFRPNDPISRAEFATLVNLAFGFTKNAEIKFADVNSDDWYAKAVSVAATQGYIYSNENNCINPKGKISRKQAAVTLGNISNLTGAAIDTSYNLQKPISRAETATAIYRILKTEETSVVNIPLKYDLNYLQSLRGGFVDTIEKYAKEQDLTVEEFKILCGKAASDMTEDELLKMNAIREKQLKPTPDMLMQKVITTYDMNKYLVGDYKTPKGFISICADVKQYRTLKDYYYGLRLDYKGSIFNSDENSYAVIRFQATNIEKSIIPKSEINKGTYQDPYPFGGVGFTTGTSGYWGSPEWVMPEFTVLKDGAQIFEIFQDKTETLKAVYSTEKGQFVAVE